MTFAIGSEEAQELLSEVVFGNKVRCPFHLRFLHVKFFCDPQVRIGGRLLSALVEDVRHDAQTLPREAQSRRRKQLSELSRAVLGENDEH